MNRCTCFQGFLGSLDTPARCMVWLAAKFRLGILGSRAGPRPLRLYPRDRGVVREGSTGVPRFIWHSLPSFPLALPLRHVGTADTNLPPPLARPITSSPTFEHHRRVKELGGESNASGARSIGLLSGLQDVRPKEVIWRSGG
jgi:hypothetical protein